MDKVLIIAAHPDDDILGCGGMFSKYRDTPVEFKVVFISEGTSCRFDENNIGSSAVKAEIEKRNNYGAMALEFFNVDKFVYYNLPCGRLDTVPIIDINKIIEHEIRTFEPDTIFTHSNCDVNNDHLIVFKSTLMAARPMPKNTINKIYSYEVLSSTEWGFSNKFEPNSYLKLTLDNIEEKIKALKFYKSEVRPYPFPRSDIGVKSNAIYRGMEVGVEYAEAYKLIRETRL